MKYTLSKTFISLNLIATYLAHVEMQSPPPRKSQFNKGYGQAPDFDMNSPLGAFPCKGYGKGPSVQSVSAGSPIQVKLLGEASHNGGHCQFSLSYDNGATFVVIKTIMSECLRADGYDYNVQIPKEAPNGDVIFAWSWVNRTGNREYYMNCADITITGSSSNSLSGPKLLVANIPGYPTIPEFTDGGYDGSDLYSKCPKVAVNGSGASSQNSTATYQSSSRNSYSSQHLSQSGYSSQTPPQNSSSSPQSSPQNEYAYDNSSPKNNYSVSQPSPQSIAYTATPIAPSTNSYATTPTPTQGYAQVNIPSGAVDYNTISYPPYKGN